MRRASWLMIHQSGLASAVGAHEGILAPGRGREDDVGETRADRIDQIDVLVDHHHAARIGPPLEGVDDVALVVRANLVRVGQHQFVEPLGDLLRAAHGLNPRGADAVRQAGMAGHQPGIGVERPTPAPGHLHG
jgi:hypothetical protein